MTAGPGSVEAALADRSLARAVAREALEAEGPRHPEVHRVDTGGLGLLWVVNGSRLYEVAPDAVRAVDAALAVDDLASVSHQLERLGVTAPAFVDDAPEKPPRVHALSLAVAQKCNLGCTYCYAQQGGFGGAPKDMPLDTARRAVDLLIDGAASGERVNLAFLGGEPLANRAVLRATTTYAVARAAARGVEVTFSLTTNGTLLTPDDAEFFEGHGFAVSISIDGPREVHDRLRPFKSGRGSYDTVVRAVRPLLAGQRRMQVSARVTVTPGSLRLRETLDELTALGFHAVGFSPMLRSGAGGDEIGRAEVEPLLEAMIDCGLRTERALLRDERYPFANFLTALREIHRGSHRPYPCGAGAGYFGVSADGDLAACHRFVGDDAGAMGRLETGVDRQAQARWLGDRHVHRQEPCRECWARYLCGGGCHHEVIGRGRPACRYIRGWLHYCLQAYARLSRLRPDWFGAPPTGDAPPVSFA
jgi:uncharacterized protein